MANAVLWAAAKGNGFIGEFNGMASALTSNSNGYSPMGLIDGDAGALGRNVGGSNGVILQALGGRYQKT